MSVVVNVINSRGFTLAELLTVLVVLGVIATFTIPKILTSQQYIKYNAISKEAFGAVSGAYQTFLQNGPISSSTNFAAVLPYMNYVQTDTTSSIDGGPTDSSTSYTCTQGTASCVRLHSGALLKYYNCAFGGTSNSNFLWLTLEPAGKVSGQKDSLTLLLYANGRATTYGNMQPNSQDCGTTYSAASPAPWNDPAWVSW